jgi:Spy/CpxP family protein refolding chaperone
MKKRTWMIGLGAVLVVFLAAKGFGAYRWSKLSAEEKAGTITEKMAQHLGLSEDQKGKLYALNLEKMASLESAKNSGQHNREDWKKLREDWKNEVRGVLTPEQQAKFCN